MEAHVCEGQNGAMPEHDDPVSPCFRIDVDSTYLVESRTPYDIQIDHGSQRLIVPGLATRRMSGVRLQVFERELVGLRQRHQLRVMRYHKAKAWSTVFGLTALFALMALPVILVVRFIQDGTFLRRLTAQLLSVTLAVGVVALAAWLIAEQRRNGRRDKDERADGDVADGSSGLLEPDTSMGRRLWNFGVLLVMFTVGVLLPATWIYFGTELHDIVSFDGGLSIARANAAEATWRSIQICYVAVLVTLPAVLYFLFDRVHINGLIHQWSRDIFRLDRRVETMADVQARYGHRLAGGVAPVAELDAARGEQAVADHRRHPALRRRLDAADPSDPVARHDVRGDLRRRRRRRPTSGAGGPRGRPIERPERAGDRCRSSSRGRRPRPRGGR